MAPGRFALVALATCVFAAGCARLGCTKKSEEPEPGVVQQPAATVEKAPEVPPPPPPVAPPPVPEVRHYTVQRGDTLEGIAVKMYGDRTKWRLIFEANRDKITNKDRIFPGQELVIP